MPICAFPGDSIGFLKLTAMRRLEAYLTIRGEEFLAQQGHGTGAEEAEPLSADVRDEFVPGAGMGMNGAIGNGNGQAVKKRK
jgi:hypothetical protein